MQTHLPSRSYSTRRVGEIFGGIQSGSLLSALYRNGHYCGITPIKLPNGRLLWPADEVDALAAGNRSGNVPGPSPLNASARGRCRGSASVLELCSLATIVGVLAAVVSLATGVAQ